MKSASIGTQAASPSRRNDRAERRAGFTLIEALVSLSLLLAFATVLGPLMFQSRHILLQGDGQVRAELLLRSLLETPFDRVNPELGLRQGESDGLRWRVFIEPVTAEAMSFDTPHADPKKKAEHNWSLLRVTAQVSWSADKIVTAETRRLGEFN
ncbi:prepilin-type N-terminal cleavage/methylation domain-containing protein [Methyloferula stellata]|uniref:prepilin-type N-terminal cleavage/methylation domain-containing protein n=1 Tax=Methyloferula stellata TaxID=876270 RepID=UPI001268D1C1|nr:prepilin-type N-terminal cleavage/methylation domain-containing protein [Methyloferula stellata]